LSYDHLPALSTDEVQDNTAKKLKAESYQILRGSENMNMTDPQAREFLDIE